MSPSSAQPSLGGCHVDGLRVARDLCLETGPRRRIATVRWMGTADISCPVWRSPDRSRHQSSEGQSPGLEQVSRYRAEHGRSGYDERFALYFDSSCCTWRCQAVVMQPAFSTSRFAHARPCPDLTPFACALRANLLVPKLAMRGR
jgi:hypothetical protein